MEIAGVISIEIGVIIYSIYGPQGLSDVECIAAHTCQGRQEWNRINRDSHFLRLPTFFISASTIILTSSSNCVFGCQPSFCLALEQSPNRMSTSAGLKNSG